MPTKRRKPPTPAQIEARRRFAEMVSRQSAQRKASVSAGASRSDARREATHVVRPQAPVHRGRHVVLTTVTATQPNTGLAGAAVTGDSLTTRNYGRTPEIIAAWSTRQVAGHSQLSWPTAHDTTRGWRVGVPLGGPQFTLPMGQRMPLTPQEQITSNIAGSNTAGDVEQDSWLTEYDQDQGQIWISPEELRRRFDKITTIEASITSAAGPGYSGTELINSDSDLLLANRDYAILGATCRTACHALGIIGPDTGNDRLAVPGMLRYELGSRFFPGWLGMCPVFNSGNKGATSLFVHTDENAGTFLVAWHLALLARSAR